MLQFLPTNKYTTIYNSDVSWSCESLEYLRYSFVNWSIWDIQNPENTHKQKVKLYFPIGWKTMYILLLAGRNEPLWRIQVWSDKEGKNEGWVLMNRVFPR